MADREVDAFILFNEREDAVETIVAELENRGVATYFWRRDIEAGEDWRRTEDDKITVARNVVVFLGNEGWGTNHLRLAVQAHELKKRLIPVLLADPPEGDAEKVGGLFTDKRYVDLRQIDPSALDFLSKSILSQKAREGDGPLFDRMIRTIVDGNESERMAVLDQIQKAKELNRPALSQRLRQVLSERFGPGVETNFETADRDPNRISSIRSWLLSCLIWTDPEDDKNRELFARQLEPNSERRTHRDRILRFWVLAGLHLSKATYAIDFAHPLLNDRTPEVRMLALAITDRTQAAEAIRSALHESDFTAVWPALRVLRIVPIVKLAGDLCSQLARKDVDGPVAYDTLYALSNPPMALAAAPLLAQTPGVNGLTRLILEIASESDQNSARAFARLLSALPGAEVDRALETERNDYRFKDSAELIRGFLREYRSSGGGETLVAGYASDGIEEGNDELDIREDVYTLSAIMLSRDVKPPLAIGLFGDWGTGKSFFMQSMRKACDTLRTNPMFCRNIVTIEFNAWHYVEGNLLASMVSHILERLAVHVSPAETQEEKEAALTAELSSAKANVDEATREKQRTLDLIRDRTVELENAQRKRKGKEIELRDIRAAELGNLLKDPANQELRKDLNTAIGQMGLPAVLDSTADLARVVSDAASLRARLSIFANSIYYGENRIVLILLIVVLVIVVPAAGYLMRKVVEDGFLINIGTLAAELAALLIGAAKVLKGALKQVSDHLRRFESARNRVDALLAKKREEPSLRERKLESDIANLKASEEQSEAKISAAAARVVELEDRIRALQKGRSLAEFLNERTRSDDYRKHLGLVSTIRHDFEALSKRLQNPPDKDTLNPVDRIVLYIDDLDRCPEDKVIEVLQAVHLLLAYRLFVVVVAVDPRWLLHSLRETYGAFRLNGERQAGDGEIWRTTPQNYLEKIFQIPFGLRPMTSGGYEKLVGSLMSARIDDDDGERKDEKKEIPTGEVEESKTQPETAVHTPAAMSAAKPETSAPMTGVAETELDRTKQVAHAFRVHEEALTIREWEMDFAQKLFALMPTPRAVKRFTNVYRILKAPVPADRLKLFEGTKEFPGEFQAPMLLLAMLIGVPEESVLSFPEFQKCTSTDVDVPGTLLNLAARETERAGNLHLLKDKLHPIVSAPQFPHSAELFKYWIPRVSRFSFDVGRAVESSR